MNTGGISLPRVVHTIHQHTDRRPFTVHMEQKTYLLCFEQQRFANLTAHILESHYRREGSWPNTEVTISQPLRLNYDQDKDFLKDTETRELSQLYVQEWNTDLVNDYIINNLFHMMVIEGSREKPTTRCITFRYPDSHIRRIIQNRDPPV